MLTAPLLAAAPRPSKRRPEVLTCRQRIQAYTHRQAASFWKATPETRRAARGGRSPFTAVLSEKYDQARPEKCKRRKEKGRHFHGIKHSQLGSFLDDCTIIACSRCMLLCKYSPGQPDGGSTAGSPSLVAQRALCSLQTLSGGRCPQNGQVPCPAIEQPSLDRVWPGWIASRLAPRADCKHCRYADQGWARPGPHYHQTRAL